MSDHSASDLPSVSVEPLARPQRLIVLALVDAGFRWADAKAWATGWVCDPDPTVVVAQATAFRSHGGFTVVEAIGWHKQAFSMPQAGRWMEAGYTHAQAHEVICLAQSESDAEQWIATGIPARRVIAYLRAGVTPVEAPAFETSPDMTHRTLTFMAAFLST